MNNLQTRNRNRGLNKESQNPWNSIFTDFLEPFESMMEESNFVRHLTTDINEDEDNYYIKVETPGLSKEDIEINYEEDVITILADWKEESSNGIRKGKFEKSFAVRNIDTENLEAKLKDGILSITLPKSQDAKPKKVKIN